MKITLAKSAGFCFGVKRAVDTVYEQLEMSAAERQPIYTFGPIIHNEEVVRDLEEKGVTVLESVEELEERAAHGGTVIIRAHGVEKGISEKIKEFQGAVIGVSAGAINLGKISICSKDIDDGVENTKIYYGIGRIDYTFEPHFEINNGELLKSELFPASNKFKIYGITNNTALKVSNEKEIDIIKGDLYIINNSEVNIIK